MNKEIVMSTEGFIGSGDYTGPDDWPNVITGEFTGP
jgi:hypothetical protein